MGFKKKKAYSKPYAIHFVRITARNVKDVAEWCGGRAFFTNHKIKEPRLELGDDPVIMQGDYVIRYPNGDFDLLPADVFAEFYESR